MKRLMVCLFICSLFAIGALPATGLAQPLQLERLGPLRSLYVYETLSYPDAVETNAIGIDGSNVVGSYADVNGKVHGFLYNGITYKSLDKPDATYTCAEGINGSKIVGWYLDNDRKAHGFVYNGASYETLDMPGEGNTYPSGISGSIVVGTYEDATENRGMHGFFWDGFTYKTIDAPNSSWTRISGISGNLVVGFYTVPGGDSHSCIFDVSPNPYFPPPNFRKSFDFPGADATDAYGIYENKIVGQYLANSHLHGFLYDDATSTFTTVDNTDALRTFPLGIYGNKIVGSYTNTNSYEGWQGFIRYIDPNVFGKPQLQIRRFR